MKRIFLAVAMMVAATTFVFGQSKDEQAVRQTLTEVAAALSRNDADALDRFYADDYTLVGSTGVLINKTQRLASFRNGEVKLESFTYNDVKVRVYGNTAVVNALVKYKLNGQDVVNPSTLTLVKNGDQWQIVAAQGTPISANQSPPNEAALNKFMDDYSAALLKNSPEAAESFLGDQWILVLGDGTIKTRAQHFADVRSGDLKFNSITADEKSWRMFGNEFAIGTARVTLKNTYKGKDVGGTFRVTSVLRRTGDSWRVVSQHATKLVGN